MPSGPGLPRRLISSMSSLTSPSTSTPDIVIDDEMGVADVICDFQLGGEGRLSLWEEGRKALGGRQERRAIG